MTSTRSFRWIGLMCLIFSFNVTRLMPAGEMRVGKEFPENVNSKGKEQAKCLE